MKVILLKDVRSLGRKYDVTDVADGYALNSLFPQKMAQMATDNNIKKVEALKLQSNAEKSIQEELLMKNLEAISNVEIAIHEKVNEKGHLFAAIHEQKIVEEVKKQAHIDILPEFISLEKPIKEAGEYEILVNVRDKTAKFKLIVESAGE